MTAIAAVYASIQQIKEITAEDPFLFLRVFTRAGGPLPLVALLSFLVPLVAIGLGFDLVNSEHNQRTLSRVLSQPIYRDALLLGKFLARPEIQSGADLRGRPVGVSKRGSLTHTVARRAAKRGGLGPERDVTIIELGDTAAQLAAGCDAVLGPTEDGGYHLIALNRVRPSVFADIQWSTPSVTGQRRVLRSMKLREWVSQ